MKKNKLHFTDAFPILKKFKALHRYRNNHDVTNMAYIDDLFLDPSDISAISKYWFSEEYKKEIEAAFVGEETNIFEDVYLFETKGKMAHLIYL